MSENVYARYKNYCLDETFTKAQILNIISQAVENGKIHNVDWGAVSVLKEINKNQPLRFWIGTNAEYEAINHKENNVLYIKTDDTSAAEVKNSITDLKSKDEYLEGFTKSVSDMALQSWQYLNNQPSGVSFLSDESGFYYLDSSGSKMTGDHYINWTPFSFAANGVLKTGWRTVFGKRYFYNPQTGQIQIGWIDYADHKYYVSLKDGKYVSGYALIDGAFYHFDDMGQATAVELYTKEEVDALISNIEERLSVNHGIIQFDADDIGAVSLGGFYESAIICANGHTEIIFDSETVLIQTGETDERNVTLRTKAIGSTGESPQAVSEIDVAIGSESGEIKYIAFK